MSCTAPSHEADKARDTHLRDFLGNEIHVLWDLIPELRHITNLRWFVKSTHTQRSEELRGETETLPHSPYWGLWTMSLKPYAPHSVNRLSEPAVSHTHVHYCFQILCEHPGGQ